jgi:hypothetical protein
VRWLRVAKRNWANHNIKRCGSLKTGGLLFMAAGGTLPNRFGRNDAKITRNLYPHRTLLAPRVRVVLEFLLNVMKNHAGLQAERADLQLFAA